MDLIGETSIVPPSSGVIGKEEMTLGLPCSFLNSIVYIISSVGSLGVSTFDSRTVAAKAGTEAAPLPSS